MVLLLGKHFKCFKNFASCSCSCSMSFLICMFLMQILDCRSQMWIAAWVQLDTVVCLVIWAGSDIPVLVRTLQVKRYYHFSSPGAHTKTTCLTVDLQIVQPHVIIQNLQEFQNTRILDLRIGMCNVVPVAAHGRMLRHCCSHVSQAPS